MTRRAVFTGTFDPITLGHLDIVRRSDALFDELIIGVGSNPAKNSLFSLEERVELARQCTAGIPGVRVQSFSGLTVEFVKSVNATLILRGVRAAIDTDYEVTMARTNRVLLPGLETVLLPSSESFAHLSSTLIRQIAGKTTRDVLAQFVPDPVVAAIEAKSG